MENKIQNQNQNQNTEGEQPMATTASTKEMLLERYFIFSRCTNYNPTKVFLKA